MSGWHNRSRGIRMFAAALFAFFMLSIAAGSAAAETRSLKLYYLHTGEKATITYKKNGQYIPSGLKEINWFLRDWRRNEPTKMDPLLLDLVWEAYRQSGSRDYIHIISGYRSPVSNDMLRQRGRGVAKNSQHTKGKAMDFFLPDVKLSKLREIGLKMQVGGVGYYPTSGSPFVHFDTANVRHWPRMNRQELAKIFPDGKTMHIPTDGKPLARYNEAVAAYKRRQATGNLVPSSGIALASNTGGKSLNLFERLANLAQQDKEDTADDEEANSVPAPRAVATTVAPAPQPVQEPQFAELNAGVPVPEIAPRPAAVLTEGTALAMAETNSDAQPASPDQTPNEGDAPVLAMLEPAPPVPRQRPEFATILAGGDENAGDALSEQARTSELALASALARTGASPRKLDPLSPAEIEDLRRRAIAASKQTQPETQVAGSPPLPSASIGNEEIRTAALRPASTSLESGSLNRFAETPASAQIPADQQPAAARNSPSEVLTAALANNATGSAAAESVAPPVPVRRPGINAGDDGIVMAGLAAENTSSDPGTSNEKTGTLVERPISLDPRTAPQVNSNTIGKWALASNHTIRDLADMRAPAYGRNTVREISQTILVQGFTRQLFTPAGTSFTGRAVNAERLSVLR